MMLRLGLYNLDLLISAYVQCTINFGLTHIHCKCNINFRFLCVCVHELTVYCCVMLFVVFFAAVVFLLCRENVLKGAI